VAALAGAKLNWVASAELVENFSALMLNDEARAVLDRFDDMIMRELIKDMCCNRPLRHDVFVRGARRLTEAERDAALGEVMLALVAPPDKFEWEFETPSGLAKLERSFYGPILDALGEAPRRVRDLLQLPALPRPGSPGELVGMLVGARQAIPVLAPATGPDDCVRRLNEAAARRFVRSNNLNNSMALATSGTGTPLSCPMLAWAKALAPDHPEDERQRLQEFIAKLVTDRAPLWRRLGALPASGGM
jgi:hypothetical protein